MIKITANLNGIPFNLIIDGKNVIWEGFEKEADGLKFKKIQWYPPAENKVFSMIDKMEYMQWHACRTEEQVYTLVKIDLINNGCQILNEERL